VNDRPPQGDVGAGQRPELIGSTLSQYRILARLGQGGMGDVYLAEDTLLRRKVAIKVPRPEQVDEAATGRLIREARSAAALDHPHIGAIHEIADEGGRAFIVMQYVEGETLAQRLAKGPLSPREVLDLAIPVADALAEAHRHGIVHRDVKPQNIMVGPRRQVKVMDFGLARPVAGTEPAASEAHTRTALTTPGAIAGTVAYMSPEQARGDSALDARSDVFSFGIVLYEMVTGRHPFAASSPAETLSAILSRPPELLARYQTAASPELERIVGKALRKDREERYQAMKDMALDLAALRDETEFHDRVSRSGPSDPKATPAALPSPPRAAPRPRHRKPILTAALLAAGAAVAYVYWHRSNLAWAAASVPRVEQLAADGDYAAAHTLALRVRRYRPDDPELTRLLAVIADDLSVATDPAGATVTLRRLDSADKAAPVSVVLGRTPLSHVTLPRGDYILRLELAGHEPFERSISSSVTRANAEFDMGLSPAIQIEQRLLESGQVPAGMVLVPSGAYALVGYTKPTQATVELDPFLMDRREVSNREYKEFVGAGAYRDRDYWKHSFTKDGRSVAWEDAMRLLVDRTGLPGPRGWVGGNPPDGKEDHPVTGVTWYEAAAYASFRGKALPTVFQWEKAARDGAYVIGGDWVMPWGLVRQKSDVQRANFEGSETVPVSGLEFGMSPFGCLNMAGNVSEWLANQTPSGFLTAGGSWADPPYIFGDYGSFPSLGSSAQLGFRCARLLPGATGDQGGATITERDQAPVYPRSSDESFEAWQRHYRYDQAPLEASVVETVETPDWRRETIRYRGAANEPVTATLYLPRSVSPPFQVIHFVPGSNAYNGRPGQEFAENGRLTPFIKAGRALLVVTLRGYLGREWPADRKRPDRASVAYRDLMVKDSTDLRRGLDYLETRTDIDISRVAFMNVSIGAQGIIFSAVEPRYRAVVLMSDGLYPRQVNFIPEANPVGFAPHIKPPKLMLNGRWDADYAFKSEAEPLFKLLSEPKRLELYDGGHVPPPEIAVPIVSRFLDETLGPVRGR
jgi:formylglycine-generating enzyme required for sulfatase activity/tRNA A-37 threonylcarbamoyl transferase component Bud32